MLDPQGLMETKRHALVQQVKGPQVSTGASLHPADMGLLRPWRSVSGMLVMHLMMVCLGAQVSAGEILAQSMMALLPGIDANDEHKAQAVFRFYVVALSSLPVIQVGPASRHPSFSPILLCLCTHK